MSQNGSNQPASNNGNRPPKGPSPSGEGSLGGQSREELDALAERLRIKEEELRKREEDLKSSEGRGLLKTEILKMDKGMYKFRVGPRDKQQWGDKLQDEMVETVDESEAIRWYCATHADPERKNKQVDPVRIPITAECINSKERQAVILQMNKLAFIRRKAENGTLTPEEQEMLMAADFSL